MSNTEDQGIPRVRLGLEDDAVERAVKAILDLNVDEVIVEIPEPSDLGTQVGLLLGLNAEGWVGEAVDVKDMSDPPNYYELTIRRYPAAIR